MADGEDGGAGRARGERALERLLAEQLAYYRAVAPEYERHALPGWQGNELEAALDRFCPAGEVLELACGTGAWTERLLRHARSVTALDGAPEMLAIARTRLREERVCFVQADLFSWRPRGAYDVVFFAFWLSHVPHERFESFWALVSDCLRPRGRVFFLDDAHRTPSELLEGDDGTTVRRQLFDGSAHRVVKVPHAPGELERRLRSLGWRVRVTQARGPFFWGVGARA